MFFFHTDDATMVQMIPTDDSNRRRQSRFLKKRIKGIKKLIGKMSGGKDLIWQTYAKQFWKNWKLNYEYVYRAYFMKMGQILDSSTEQ